jgi:hypothetical protein
MRTLQETSLIQKLDSFTLVEEFLEACLQKKEALSQ